MNRLHAPARLARCVIACAAALAIHPAANAQTSPTSPPEIVAATQLEPVTVQGNYLNPVGSSDAASQGSVTAKLIQSRPTLRPAEVNSCPA